MSEIKFKVPDAKAPGFLKRQKRALVLNEAFESRKATAKDIDELIEFLADFIVEPPVREDAVEALWDASEEQLLGLLSAISDNGAVPPNK